MFQTYCDLSVPCSLIMQYNILLSLYFNEDTNTHTSLPVLQISSFILTVLQIVFRVAFILLLLLQLTFESPKKQRKRQRKQQQRSQVSSLVQSHQRPRRIQSDQPRYNDRGRRAPKPDPYPRKLT